MPTFSLVLLLTYSGLVSQDILKIPGHRNTFLMEKNAFETSVNFDLVKLPSLLSG